jgi:uncharacterized membrane protein YfcA
MVGIAAGTLTFGFMSAATVRIIVGLVAIAFTAHYVYSTRHKPDSALPHFPPSVGIAAGAAGGFTATSLVLAPLAPVGVYTGVWLHRRVSDSFFFRLMYVVLFVVGCKLLYDGVTAGH